MSNLVTTHDYFQHHREEYRRRKNEWYQRNRTKYLAGMRLRYATDAGFRDMRKAQAKRYHDSHREWLHALDRKKHQLNKLKIINHYSSGSNRCSCCGLADILFLTIDHINGRGKQQMKSVNALGGSRFYRWLVKSNFPDGFQVLCFNCNMGKAIHGVCPHQKPIPYVEWVQE